MAHLKIKKYLYFFNPKRPILFQSEERITDKNKGDIIKG